MAKLPDGYLARVDFSYKTGYFSLEEGVPFRTDPRDLLRQIDDHIQAGTAVPENLRAYFHESIQHKDLNKGFGIKSGQPTKDRTRLFYDFHIYYEVKATGLGLHCEDDPTSDEYNKRNDESQGTKGAFWMIGHRLDKSPKTVEKAYYRVAKILGENVSPKSDSNL